MKAWLMIVGVCTAITATAADWKQELAAPQKGNFPLPRASHASYTFGWSALTAATATFDIFPPKSGLLALDVTLRTTGAARSLFRLDAQHHALAQAASLRPVSMLQSEAYSDETIKIKLDFDSTGVTRTRTSNVGTAGKAKRFDFIPVFDLYSAFIWVRSQPLLVGEIYRLVVYPSTDPFLVEFSIVGADKIKVADTNYKALKLDVKLKRLNKQLEVEPYQRLKKATAWISDDADRLLLKAETEVFIGSVWAELKSVTFPAP